MFSYALYICYICNVNTHTCISMVIHKFGKHCIYHFSHLPLEIHLQIKNITTLPYPQLEVKYPYLATQNIYKSFALSYTPFTFSIYVILPTILYINALPSQSLITFPLKYHRILSLCPLVDLTLF